MIKGMTGFGTADVSSGKLKGFVEIKSLNHRYLDIVYNLPIGFASTEDKIRRMIQQRIQRGRISVTFKITSKPAQEISFNKEAMWQYLAQAKALKRKAKISGELSLSTLVQLPGVVETKDILVSGEALWPSLSGAIQKALNGLMVMRSREGRTLASEMRGLLSRMLSQINKIKSRQKAVLKEKRKGLTEEEFVSFQKNSDVSEELSRLAHHTAEFRLLLKSNVPVGKGMDFIAQEMQRETNTIGSKLQDKIVGNAVIALKSKVEKIREQSQNIE